MDSMSLLKETRDLLGLLHRLFAYVPNLSGEGIYDGAELVDTDRCGVLVGGEGT